MTEYTSDDLDIIAGIDDGIAPHDWRNNSSWFEGKMVKPLTNDALNYCATNGTYFDTPNAYFVEGYEDGDCDCEVLCVGKVPPLGDLDQSQLKQIWEECFAHPSVDTAQFIPRPEPCSNLAEVRAMPRAILIQRTGGMDSRNGSWTVTVNPGHHPSTVRVLSDLCWEEMLGEIAAATIPNEVFMKKNRFSGGVNF